MKINEKCEEQADVLILILIVRIGQACVKRGFTINKPVLKMNMKEGLWLLERGW